ncbi:MAG: hypothetical protein Q8L48_03775 [Archangium sp.]|nr:hypothetical protein [Archangium sp.]
MWRCAVLSLACTGCFNPDDILAAHGRVASVDPVEGQVVRLLRYVNNQPDTFPGEEWCSLATPLKETRADAEGKFGYEVFRVETRSALCFRIDASFPSGSVAWSDFTFYGPETQLAPLLDWRAAPWLDAGVLHFDPPVPWPDDLPPLVMGNRTYVGIQLTHREQLVTTDGGIAWQADDRLQVPDASVFPYEYAREPLVMDALRLEDFEGTLSLSAWLYDPDQEVALVSSGTSPTRMRAGERLALRGTRVPLSRGLPCPELGTPCPLTDRELTTVDAGLINEVALNLLTPSMVSAIVIRGASIGDGLIRIVLATEDGGVAAELEHTVPYSGFGPSPGGESFRLPDGGYAQLRLAYVVLPVDAGTPSSRVILQFPAGLARIQEVSLFE